MVNIKRMALLLAPTAMGLAVLVWWSRKRSHKAEPEAAPASGAMDYETLANDPAERKKMMSAVGRVAGKSKRKPKAEANPASSSDVAA